MIKVDFPEPTGNADWTKWRGDCEEARDTLITRFDQTDQVKVNSDLYKKMKQVLFDTFQGKCAFCEAKIDKTDQHGDVEHFRPKKAVTDENDRPIIVTWRDGKQREHPGYYWLAYEWTNLLPSCVLCNQPNTSRDGKPAGKRNRFPIEGKRACGPGEEDDEHPVLIHPVREDPADHLDVDLETGVLLHRTERGKKCIEILDLNRDGLVDGRRELYEILKGYWNSVYSAATEKVSHGKKLDLLLAHKRGAKAYTLVARKTLEQLKERKKAVDQIIDE